LKQSTLVPIRSKTLIKKPPTILYCFYCGKQILFEEHESWSFYQGVPCHTACIPKTDIDDFKGRLHEFLVANELIRRGFEVYLPCHTATHVDLLIRKGKRELRIQVRTANAQNKGFHVGLGMGCLHRRWEEKQEDVEALVVVCPPNHFFIIPALVVKGHWSLSLSLNPTSRYGAFLDNWEVLDEIKTNLEVIAGEEESQFLHQMPILTHKAWRSRGKTVTGITVGEDSEIILKNILEAIYIPYLPLTEDFYILLTTKMVVEVALHELVHQIFVTLPGGYSRLDTPGSPLDNELKMLAMRLSNESFTE
jgi:hypothetical protein